MTLFPSFNSNTSIQGGEMVSGTLFSSLQAHMQVLQPIQAPTSITMANLLRRSTVVPAPSTVPFLASSVPRTSVPVKARARPAYLPSSHSPVSPAEYLMNSRRPIRFTALRLSSALLHRCLLQLTTRYQVLSMAQSVVAVARVPAAGEAWLYW